jgi:hypothetical protein
MTFHTVHIIVESNIRPIECDGPMKMVFKS